MKKQPHFSSIRLDWKTPKAVYQVLDAEFGFDFDPCPPDHRMDGLTSDWGGGIILQPSIWAGIAKVDREGVWGMEKRKDCCVPNTKPDGH